MKEADSRPLLDGPELDAAIEPSPGASPAVCHRARA
jgi:hypothetical protein